MKIKLTRRYTKSRFEHLKNSAAKKWEAILGIIKTVKKIKVQQSSNAASSEAKPHNT